MAYNKAIFAGNLTKDPELKVTQTGKSICTFRIGVKRRFQDVTDFHNCVAWGKTAETISRSFQKGKEILVEGELQNRSYTDKDGIKHWVTELMVEAFSFTGRKDEPNKSYNADLVEVEEEDDDLPF